MSLTRPQLRALDLLVQQEYRGYNNGEASTSAEASDLIDGQAFIHWRTAEALHRRGLVEVGDYFSDEGAAIWLKDAGRDVAARPRRIA